MKKLILKLLSLLILINFSSCSSRKLNKQKFESSATAQSEIRLQDLNKAQYEGRRMILMTDSSDELYTISIIPKDTFSFSTQQGFRGKAERIEVRGLVRRAQARSDSTIFEAEQQNRRIYEEQKQSKMAELLRNGVFERKSWSVVMVFIVVGVILVIGWWVMRRFRRA